jgi:hypothetical protein
MSTSFRRGQRLSAFVLLSLTGAACGKDKGAASDTSTPVATHAAATTLSVADVATGRHIGPDKRIADATAEFGTRDTIYASVHTTGTATNRALVGKWTFENGSVVDQRSDTISPTGDAYTEFHILKPTGWPKGKYTLHVLLDGTEVQTKDVTVK